MRQRVKFYFEVLQTEAEHGLDLDYWLDFVVANGVDGAIPSYDKMSTIKYLNLEVYAIIALALYVVFSVIRTLLGLSGLCKVNDKSQGDKSEEDQRQKTD